ncbi:MuDR family transposase, partial [Striga hermonthica]
IINYKCIYVLFVTIFIYLWLPFYNLQVFAALQRTNPGTVVEWEWKDGEMARHSRDKEFRFVFWAFGPAIRTFHLCPAIISIDDTHLRGSYKGKLL